MFFFRLVATADVVIQNYAGSALDRLGLGYDDLAQIRPDLIYCSLTGYGRTGPKAEHPAYDLVIQAYSGLMYANGWGDDGDRPLRVGPPVIDYGTGMQAAFAVAAALFQRQRTGKGQNIDLAMADAALMLMTAHVGQTLATGKHTFLPTAMRIQGARPILLIKRGRVGSLWRLIQKRNFQNSCEFWGLQTGQKKF